MNTLDHSVISPDGGPQDDRERLSLLLYTRDGARVVEHFAFDSHPVSQSIAAHIVPRDSGFMGSTAGCLANNQDFRAATSLQERARSQRQVLFTLAAFPNLGQQVWQWQHILTLSNDHSKWVTVRSELGVRATSPACGRGDQSVHHSNLELL